MTSSASASKLGYVGSVPGSKKRDSDSWFTPKNFTDSARKVMGSIDLDPFSSAAANKLVQATKFYTEEDDAFQQNWKVRRQFKDKAVWMNPPYSGKLCKDAVNKFIDCYDAGNFDTGIFLVNNSTETVWFQRALLNCNAVCFPAKRISFWNVDGKAVSGNTRGQAFFYFGNNAEKFFEEFDQYGSVIVIR